MALVTCDRLKEEGSLQALGKAEALPGGEEGGQGRSRKKLQGAVTLPVRDSGPAFGLSTCSPGSPATSLAPCPHAISSPHLCPHGWQGQECP